MPPTPRRRCVLARAIVGWIIGLGSIAPAFAADLKVLCPNALRAPVLEITRSFVRTGGQRVELVFASVGAIHKRIATGEKFDVAIGTAQGVDALVKLGRGDAGSSAMLVRSAVGVVTSAERDTVQPLDAQALAALLRDAGVIVMPDTAAGAPGGAQAAELIERLELAAEIKHKIKRVADPRDVGKRVAAGDAQLGIAAMSDLIAGGNAMIIGPITDPPTGGIVYAALMVRASERAHTGSAYVTHLRSSAAAAVFRTAGYLAVP